MIERARARLLLRVLTLVSLTLGTTAALAVGAQPASAATCATAGHAYLTQSGRVLFSGFEGDQRFGVPTFNTFRGSTFNLGANGIRPFDFVTFVAVDPATGAELNLDFFGNGQASFSLPVGENCVANEQQFTVRVPDGRYRLTARYSAGNSGARIDEPVVDIVVDESNRPVPTPRPRPPCLSICTA
jgi:hypothetical protein